MSATAGNSRAKHLRVARVTRIQALEAEVELLRSQKSDLEGELRNLRLVGQEREASIKNTETVQRIAVRDALLHRNLAKAACTAASAAQHCIAAGLLGPADSILRTVQEIESFLTNQNAVAAHISKKDA